MPKALHDEDYRELKHWLKNHNVESKKLHREFSDGLAVATILKKYYPKLVDLHNYPSRSAVKHKIENWNTLNFKIFGKLNMVQSKPTIEKLANATPGVIENFLFDLMTFLKSNEIEDNVDQEYLHQLWCENEDVMMINVNKKIGDAIVQIPQKMILFSIYEENLRELRARETQLAAANQKVSHLENILQLKSERIDELCTQLAKQSARYLVKQQGLDNSENSNEKLGNGKATKTKVATAADDAATMRQIKI